jgi:hypothetical protein
MSSSVNIPRAFRLRGESSREFELPDCELTLAESRFRISLIKLRDLTTPYPRYKLLTMREVPFTGLYGDRVGSLSSENI